MPSVDLTQSTQSAKLLTPLWKVNVEEYSLTLHRENVVHVFKEGSDTPSYTIDAGGCSCPAAQYGSAMCKHLLMVERLGAL